MSDVRDLTPGTRVLIGDAFPWGTAIGVIESTHRGIFLVKVAEDERYTCTADDLELADDLEAWLQG
jgi:hypothetical protein